jgi:hypothetical protein
VYILLIDLSTLVLVLVECGRWCIYQRDDNGVGSGVAFIFERDEKTGKWPDMETKLILPSDGAAGDNFGYSVGISDNSVIVCSRFDDDKGSNSDSAYIF